MIDRLSIYIYNHCIICHQKCHCNNNLTRMQNLKAMKVHHFSRGFWEHEPTSLSLGRCKRLRPLAPKLISTTTAAAATTTTIDANFDLKSFIRPESGPRKPGSEDSHQNKESPQVEAQAGGTRWNPTQEQITILEMLYRGGMRTPNAQQIEQISVQLAKYGKIEGKNVFYWFQNHKARERQKQKRITTTTTTCISSSPSPPPFISSCQFISSSPQEEFEYCTPYKRKWRSWGFDQEEEEEQVEDRTLNLFPLHPEGIKFMDY
ncbi:hypothetical protein ACP275_14G270400 [Erythranthe tilingii]